MTDSMSPSEMLSAYMDGELDEQSTSMLFYHMANDVDLQQEMQQLMAIRTATSSSTVQVPVHLKHAVFAETIGVDDHVVAAGGLGGLATAGLVMGAAAIASLATAWLLMPDSSSELTRTRPASATVIISQQKPVLSEPPRTEERIISSDMNDQTGNSIKPTAPRVKLYEESVEAEKIVMGTHNNSTLSSESYEKEILLMPQAEGIQQENVHSIIASEYRPVSTLYSMQGFGTIPPLSQLTFQSPEQEPTTIELSVRGLLTSSLQTTSLTVPSQPLYSNMGVGVLYRLGDNDKIGIEAGYDRWTQIFEGKEGDTSVKFEQIYNAPWLGIAYRHTMNPIQWLSNASPYMQGGLGVTALGPVGRIALGVEYPLFHRVTLSAGMEASGLAYQYQGAIFASQRIAFVSMVHIGL